MAERGTGSVVGNVGAVWRALHPDERQRWVALIPAGLGLAALELVCAWSIFQLIQVISGGESRWFSRDHLLAAAGLIAALFVAKGAFAVVVVRANHRAVEAGRAAVAGRLFAGALDRPWPVHLERGLVHAAHDLLSRSAVVFDAVVGPAAQLVTNGLTAVALVALLAVQAPWVTLGVAAVLVFWVGVVHRLTRRLADRAGRAEDTAGRAVLADVWQALGALREIRSLGREAHFHGRFQADQAKLVQARYQRATLAILPRLWTDTLFVLLMLGVVLALADAPSARTFGVLGLCAYAALRLLPIANVSAWHLSQIRWATPAVRQLVEDAAQPAPTWREREPPPVRPTGAAVVVEDLRYHWPDGPPVLAGVSLAIEAGDSLAIEGLTGAGKSTLLGLVAGLLEPTSGAVSVAGLPPREAPVRIGYLPQEVVVLDGTVADNITLGAELDHDRLAEALRIARADHLEPDAAVGEGGARLSGGERQRLAIARALYHQPALLLLDEATAALDKATESALIEGLLEHLKGRCTLVVVTHRPGAAAACARRLTLSDEGLQPVQPALQH